MARPSPGVRNVSSGRLETVAVGGRGWLSVDKQIRDQRAASGIETVLLELALALFAQDVFVDQQASADAAPATGQDGVGGIGHDRRGSRTFERVAAAQLELDGGGGDRSEEHTSEL